MPGKEDYVSMEIREFLKKQGAKGGQRRAKRLSPERLSEIGKLGAKASAEVRSKKARAKKAAAASAKIRSAKAKAKAKTKGE
jgi:general stress protein YciG